MDIEHKPGSSTFAVSCTDGFAFGVPITIFAVIHHSNSCIYIHSCDEHGDFLDSLAPAQLEVTRDKEQGQGRAVRGRHRQGGEAAPHGPAQQAAQPDKRRRHGPGVVRRRGGLRHRRQRVLMKKESPDFSGPQAF